jgi:hypothetical protein
MDAAWHATVSDGVRYGFIFLYYLVAFFIASFFQAAMYTIISGRFGGDDLSFTDGLRGAVRNIGRIFAWSLISSTVGVILRLIGDKSRMVGKIVAALLGAAWNILTYFSLPSLIIGRTTIIGAFKESAAIIRKTWGETLIVNVGTGLFFGVLTLAILVIVGILAVVLVAYEYLIPAAVVAGLFIVYAIAQSIFSSTLAAIFKLALYEYGRTGKIVGGFSAELIQNAFKKK